MSVATVIASRAMISFETARHILFQRHAAQLIAGNANCLMRGWALEVNTCIYFHSWNISLTNNPANVGVQNALPYYIFLISLRRIFCFIKIATPHAGLPGFSASAICSMGHVFGNFIKRLIHLSRTVSSSSNARN